MDIDIPLLKIQKDFKNDTSPMKFIVSSRAVGKSFVLTLMAMMYLMQGHNVILCGQTFQAVRDVLFNNYLQMWRTKFKMEDIISITAQPLQVKFNNHYIYSGSYENIDALRGLTDCKALLLDEFMLAPINILGVLGPCLRGPNVGDPVIAGTSTPNFSSPWQQRIIDAPKYGYSIHTGTLFDNTFLTDSQRQLMLDSITDPVLRDQELYGKIIVNDSATTMLKPTDFTSTPGETLDNRVICGVDCSGGGYRDAHAVVVRKGTSLLFADKFYGMDSFALALKLRELHNKFSFTHVKFDRAFSDGVYEELRWTMPCEQINFAERAEDPEKYANKRAEMWFNVADAVRKTGLCVDVPNRDDLTEEIKKHLCSIHYLINGQNRLLIQPKEEIREIIGCSPDLVDALALTLEDGRWLADSPKIITAIKAQTETRRKALSMMG